MSKAPPSPKAKDTEPARTATAQPVADVPERFLERPLFHLLLLALVAVIAYANTFRVPFLFDDHSSIVANPVIKDLSAFLSGAGYAYNPRRFVGYLSFALNYKLGGLDVTGYHVINLAIHIISAWLVYSLVRLTLKTPFFTMGRAECGAQHSESENFYISNSLIPLLAALMFVAHPVQTQAVTYIVQRLASLVTLFYVASLVFYIEARLAFGGNGERVTQNSKLKTQNLKSFAFFSLSLIAALAAMRTKEIAATLPLVVVLYEFSFFGASARKRFLFLIPLLLTILIIPIGMLHAGKPLGELLSDVSEMARETLVISRGDYLLTQFAVIATYLRLLFFPVSQNLDYDYPIYHSLFAPRVFLSFAFLAALLGVAVWLYYRSGSQERGSGFEVRGSENLDFTSRLDPRTSRLISFGILWFFITISVESSVIPISDVIFEHRLYLPSAGAFIALAALAALVFRKYPQRTFATAGAIAVLVLAAVTWQRNLVWGNALTLWIDTMEKSPNKNRPHHNLGKTLMEQGKVDEAIREFQNAVSLAPDDPFSRFNLGTAYDNSGFTDEAIEQFREAIRLKGDYADAHDNLGVAYGKKGLFDKAIEEFLTALRISPAYAKTHYNLALAYRAKELLDQAVAEYKTALSLEPDSADTHNNLGAVYWQMGLADQAIGELEAAVRLSPDDREYRANLAKMRQLKESRH